jgi:hypothetical protein
MFQDRYFVPKSTDTYADALTAWGLAAVLEDVLRQAGQPRANRVIISEEPAAFIVELPAVLQASWIDATKKTRLTYFIAKDAASASQKAGDHIVDMDEQWKKIARQKEWKSAGNKPDTDDPILREQWLSLQPHEHFSLFAAANYLKGQEPNNNIWDEVEKVNYPQMLKGLLEFYSHSTSIPRLGKVHSVATMLNPGQGTGTNTLAPLGCKSKKIDSPWTLEWLKLIGFYRTAICATFRNRKEEVVNVSVIVLCPHRITLRNHFEVYRNFLSTFRVFSAIKLECLVALQYADAFLLYSRHESESGEASIHNIAEAVSGFSVVNFMLVGQAKNKNYRPKRITYLAMPLWILIPADGNAEPIREAVAEHIKIISGLARKDGKDVEPNGEEHQLLSAYLAWSSSGELRHLWKFCALYGAYRMECAANAKLLFQPTELTTTNLEVILMSQNVGEKPLAPVVQDPHFQNIARALYKSTIGPLQQVKVFHKELPSGMEIHYGLAQEWGRAALYRDKFVRELMRFIQNYNAENAKVRSREMNKNNPHRRTDITTYDVQHIIKLIDEYGAETMCGLLLAYGYAREPREEEDTSTDLGDSPSPEQI